MGAGGGDKTTIMVLKVDLQCCSCYKKVKKILCKFPQIRNQVYDEKSNTVTISVVCCNPEKLRDKLCSKGCGVITSIEIKEPPANPKPPNKPQKTPEPPPVVPPPAQEPVCTMPNKPQKTPEPPPVVPPERQPVVPPPAQKPVCTMPMPMPIQEYPQPPPGFCCEQCSEGRPGGPCYQWHGRPVPPPPCYSYYGYRRVCYVSTCDHYFSDENATGCSIM